jgi:hypothetical protein
MTRPSALSASDIFCLYASTHTPAERSSPSNTSLVSLIHWYERLALAARLRVRRGNAERREGNLLLRRDSAHRPLP